MDMCTINEHYLDPLLDNLSQEANKTIVLLGDFNIDLLNRYIRICHIFLDDLASNLLQPQILLPTRISNNSKTLIYIFVIYQTHWSKVQIYQTIFHNSLYYQSFFSMSSPTKYNIISHDWEKFNNQ